MTAVTKTWLARLPQPFGWLSSVALPSSLSRSVPSTLHSLALHRVLAAALSSVLCRSLSSVLCRLVPSTLHSLTLHRLLAVAALLCLTWSVASTLAVFPHELSYFNEIVGGPLNGGAHLLDANLDWGQDLLELKHWYDAHPVARPFHLAYFGQGFIDPRTAGIEFARIPFTREYRGREFHPGIASEFSPAWFAVSANDMHGYAYNGEAVDDYRWLKQLPPTVLAGYSIQVLFAPKRIMNPAVK